ncbi:MAG: tripartite tricarboxylate transporter substrate binding protein, partial [Burkholderiales bacterium]
IYKYLFLNDNLKTSLLAITLLTPTLCHAQPTSELAQLLPQRPVLMVVPNAAGGPSDIAARLIAPRLSEVVKQNFIVDNRASANGVTGTDYVAKATPNGTFLSVGNTGTHAINGSLYKKPLYDPVRDFTAVAPVMTGGLVLAIFSKLPVQNFREFIAYTKAQQGKVNAAIAGATGEIATNAIKMIAGANMSNVPYKGGIPAVIAVSAGESHMVFTNPSGVQPQIDTGRLRAIAVTGARRESTLPNVPTLSESGMDGFTVEFWTGVFLPSQTPAKIVQAYAREINRITALPEVKDRLTGIGYQMMSATPEAFGAMVKRDAERFRKIIIESKMQQLE